MNPSIFTFNTPLQYIAVCKATDVLSKVDTHHPPLEIKLILHKYKASKGQLPRTRNFNKCDYSTINNTITQIDWKLLFAPLDTNYSVNSFYNQINTIINNHTKISPKQISKFPNWFSKKLIYLINFKNKLRSKFKKYKDPEYYNMYAKLRARVKSEIKLSYASYI